MKMTLVVLVLVAIAFFALNINRFISTNYSSLDMGLSFDHGISWSISKSSADELRIVRSGIGSGSGGSIFIKKVASTDNVPIDFRLSRDTSLSTYDESPEKKGSFEGVSFSWKDGSNEEKGYAFGAGDYIYVVGTEGSASAPKDFGVEMDRVLNTLKIE